MSDYIYVGNSLIYFEGQLYVEKIIDGKVYYFVMCTDEQSDKIWMRQGEK
ncbi:hypothetical protein KAX02_09320 [candidate division WOR-3 bacterium]|nr:hypothetical protein [candidate division WOR-3 bacterium]